jgi:hypothetical protein
MSTTLILKEWINSFPLGVESKSASFDADIDFVYICTSSLTVTLPSPKYRAKIVIKMVGALTISLNGDGNDVEGDSFFVMSSSNSSITLVADGNEWYII